MIILLLMWEYFKIGLFAVGGGLATLPFIVEMSQNTGWFTMDDISNMVAISESTPGPLGINMAAYVGFIMEGLQGSILATLAIVTPSIIVIITVANILDKFKNSNLVKNVFSGLRPASVALITAACFSVLELCVMNPGSEFSFSLDVLHNFNYFAIIYGIILVFVMKRIEKHPIISILLSATIGIGYGVVTRFII